MVRARMGARLRDFSEGKQLRGSSRPKIYQGSVGGSTTVINDKLVDVFNNAQHRVRAGWVSDLERWVLDGFMIVCGLERDRYRPVWVEGNYACGSKNGERSKEERASVGCMIGFDGIPDTRSLDVVSSLYPVDITTATANFKIKRAEKGNLGLDFCTSRMRRTDAGFRNLATLGTKKCTAEIESPMRVGRRHGMESFNVTATNVLGARESERQSCVFRRLTWNKDYDLEMLLENETEI
ncbi:hypothetical protein C8J57DRAFT_1238845 [Mycena rebaudengoi]|nr:hypothetical protein C8J57DRAFT_1238845 [Mycena rebaudengoi]